jgi:hypothetical protein
MGDAAARAAWEHHRRAFWDDYDATGSDRDFRQADTAAGGAEGSDPRLRSVRFTLDDLRRLTAPIRYMRLLVCCRAGLADAARFLADSAGAERGAPGPALSGVLWASRVVALQEHGGGGGGVWVVVAAEDADGMRRFREAYAVSEHATMAVKKPAMTVIPPDGSVLSAHAFVTIEQVCAAAVHHTHTLAHPPPPPPPCAASRRTGVSIRSPRRVRPSSRARLVPLPPAGPPLSSAVRSGQVRRTYKL